MKELFEIFIKTIATSFLILFILGISCIIVCTIVKWISMFLGYEYSRALAVALWVVLVALIGPSFFMED